MKSSLWRRVQPPGGSWWRPQVLGRRLLLSCAIVLAVLSRFHRLAEESVWLDEATTWLRANLSLPELFADCVQRLHNPSYFLMMHYVLRLGDDELMLRLPSAVMASAALCATAVLGYVCGGYRAALGALLVISTAPDRLHYDQEARMYAQYGLGAAVMLCGLLWLIKHPQAAAQGLWRSRPGLGSASKVPERVTARERPARGPGSAEEAVPAERSGPGKLAAEPARPAGERRARSAFVALVVGALLALYAHNTAVLLVACAGLCAMFSMFAGPARLRWALARNYAAAFAAVLLLFGPWVYFLLRQTERIREHFWAPFPDAMQFRKVLFGLYLHGQHSAALTLLIVALLGCGLWALRRNRPLLGALLLLSFLTPPLILLISLERPIFLLRVMLWVGIPFAALLGCGLAALRTPQFVMASGLFLLFGVNTAYQHYFMVRRKPPFRPALMAVTKTPNSVLLLASYRAAKPTRYYLKRKTRPLPRVPYHSLHRGRTVDQVDAWVAGKSAAFILDQRWGRNSRRAVRKLRRWGGRPRAKYYGRGLILYRFRPRARGGRT